MVNTPIKEFPAIENGECGKMGIQATDSKGLLECRKVAGNKLIFIRITNVFNTIINPASPDPLNVSIRIKTDALKKQQTLNLSIISETNVDIVKWDNTPLIKGSYWFESRYRYPKIIFHLE